MSRANRLLALQEIDTQHDRVSARLAKVIAALKDHRAVAAAQHALAEAEAALAEIEPRYRTAHHAREAAKAHLDREQKKLYSGTIRAPKELQNYQRETEALQRELADRDDKLLELMLARDDARDRVRAASEQLEAVQAKAATGAQSLSKERDRLEAERVQLQARRDRASAGIPAADLAAYQRLRAAKGGQAVSRLVDGECATCGMQLPRHQADQVAGSHGLVNCPGCGRILAV